MTGGILFVVLVTTWQRTPLCAQVPSTLARAAAPLSEGKRLSKATLQRTMAVSMRDVFGFSGTVCPTLAGRRTGAHTPQTMKTAPSPHDTNSRE